MKRLSIRISALLLALVTALALCPNPAFAATRRVTAKRFPDGAYTTTIAKKATVVKRGRTKVTLPKGGGWVKFTAPAKKQYKINVYRASSSAKPFLVNGLIRKASVDGGFYDAKFKSYEGTCDYILVSGPALPKNTQYYNGKNYHFLGTRSCKLTLKKKQTIYMWFGGFSSSGSETSGSFYLYIK